MIAQRHMRLVVGVGAEAVMVVTQQSSVSENIDATLDIRRATVSLKNFDHYRTLASGDTNRSVSSCHAPACEHFRGGYEARPTNPRVDPVSPRRAVPTKGVVDFPPLPFQ